jgi:hypothetical protein
MGSASREKNLRYFTAATGAERVRPRFVAGKKPRHADGQRKTGRLGLQPFLQNIVNWQREAAGD